MPVEESYTTEEIAQLLKVSKLTVYDLIKKGEIPAYRVGRQMRVEAFDLEAYKNKSKGTNPTIENLDLQKGNLDTNPLPISRSIVISGQDNSLDLLTKYIEKSSSDIRPLRSYVGSMDSLIAMYKGEADVVSTHLLDGETGQYNVPYIKRIFVSSPFIVIGFISRKAGFFVSKGNPKKVWSVQDLIRDDVKIINREKGSGARVLLDEKLREIGINNEGINGYHDEETSHLGVASRISKGNADVGIGNEKVASLVGLDFIPLITERYDLVLLKTELNKRLIKLIRTILQSNDLKEELQSIGYEVSRIGKVIYEQ